MYNHNKAQQSKIRVHISWDILYIGFTPSVCMSVCPSFPRPLCSSYSFGLEPFHIYASYQAISEGVLWVKCYAKFTNLNFWQFRKICYFDFVLFWLGIWYKSLVWEIMWRGRGAGLFFFGGGSQNVSILVVLIQKKISVVSCAQWCQYITWLLYEECMILYLSCCAQRWLVIVCYIIQTSPSIFDIKAGVKSASDGWAICLRNEPNNIAGLLKRMTRYLPWRMLKQRIHGG